MDFCKQYNERTASQAGMIIPVEITVFEDRTFTFITKTPPASFLIKQALKHRVGQQGAEPQQGRQADAEAARRDRQGEDARHQRQRHRRGEEDRRRHGALDGRRGGGVRCRNITENDSRALVAGFDPQAALLDARSDRDREDATPTRSSTRRSRRTFGSASIRRRAIRTCAARCSCRTAPDVRCA